MKSARNILAFPPRRADRKQDRRREELAFLPAALEIVETPPSPIGRTVVWTIVVIFVAALAWASIGTVDIVAVALGKIIPSGRTKTIQPFETGVVRAITVRDGQSVKAGDVLIELDPTITGAELGRLKSDLLAAQLDLARLGAALSKGDAEADFKPPAEAPAPVAAMHHRLLVSQIAEQKAKLSAVDGQVAQKEAELATIRASIAKLQAMIQPLEERVEIRKHLSSKELGSRLAYLQELQELTAQRQEVLVQQSRLVEAEAAIASLAQTRSRTVAEYERGLLDDLAKAQQKAAGFVQDIVKAEQRTSLQKLTAPVDGVVQQLAVNTIGGVVTPAQILMIIVPADSQLEIEAMISNRDIGFVEAGQEVAIKVDAFNFTRYGLLQGRVLSVSHDAISRDKPQEKSGADKQQGADAATSEPKGQELVYAVRVSLDRTRIQVENKTVSLSPGMAVTVEIKTGSRSIMSYLLSPLVRYRHDSLRER
ncbi:MAG: HlyD family type I secretion periplasmic adaptor subunit [Reyranella sp.]|nr:HlyD family type I secretion periplasmic adaptor subunit [Reyranella sp.]